MELPGEMTRARSDALILFFLGSIAFLLLGAFLEAGSPVSSSDFKAVYYGTRTLLQHGDPYRESDVSRVYFAEDSDSQADKLRLNYTVALYIYPPSVVPFVLPFALLPWGPAH